MKNSARAVCVVGALWLAGCQVEDALAPKANLMAVKFEAGGVSVSQFHYPKGEAAKSASLNDSTLSKTGFDIRLKIKARNSASGPAEFDGARMSLRVEDTTSNAESFTVAVPPFVVPAGEQSEIAIDFPIRLNNPVFSRAVLEKVISGDSIPYKVQADMVFRLRGKDENGGPKELGTTTIALDLAPDFIGTRPSEEMIESFKAILENAM